MNSMHAALVVFVLGCNAVWFGAAFWFFWPKADRASKLLVAKENRTSPVAPTVVAAIRFLGGMNLALSMFAILLIIFRDAFDSPTPLFVCFAVFGVAHMSQFFGNLPFALREKNGERTVWPVLRGPMKGIFAVDLTLGLVNTAAAVTFGVVA